jgi:NAD-dependent SIR2 family protein deacetylase
LSNILLKPKPIHVPVCRSAKDNFTSNNKRNTMSQHTHLLPQTANIHQAAQLIREADSLVIAAGAGMGVDSGLPDFRGDEGFWSAYPALGHASIGFRAMASERNFTYRPELAWGFYGHRLRLYRQTVPHAGFALLKKWGERMPRGYGVFTSNVDGQFQKAGFDPARITECHGSIHHLQCLGCSEGGIWSASSFSPVVDESNCHMATADLPICPSCRIHIARPNVLMFDDNTWRDERTEAQLDRLDAWLKTADRPVVIELGAGSAIATVRHFTTRVRSKKGAKLIRINPREHAVTGDVSVGLPMGALAGLLAIEAILENKSDSKE